MVINPMLLMDFYKSVHSDMLPEGMTKSVSYFTPRDSRIERWPCVVMYGLQAFIKEYLIDAFQDYFFNVPKEEVVRSYIDTLTPALGSGVYSCEKIEKLHDLGYLPIEILAMPEGTLVPIHVPMFSITNTHPDFAWLPQALESLISAELWYPMVCATVGWDYRRIVNKYYAMTCDDDVPVRKALGNFDFRGDDGLDAALKAAGGWLLSFDNTATVPAIPYMRYMYNSDCAGYGMVSTEHFVMCSNYAVDGDEETFIRKMLTELYPHTSFSCVLDSYDYWNVVDNILPKLHKEIMEHDGCMLVRGDSGDCVEVVTKTVFKLWDEFGGTINSKGYKVLDPHVKALYGDSITIQRAENIYGILEEKGFAACNVSLGVGSFSMHCIEDDRGNLNPFTRDTFGMAIKACYGEIDGEKYFIHKKPKEAAFKKSHKGCCAVYEDNDATFEGRYFCVDQKTYCEVVEDKENCMTQVFCNGRLTTEWTLDDIRKRLHGDVDDLYFPAAEVTNKIVEWIRAMFKQSGGKKAVIGISGGKDSSVVAALCVEALGVNNVIGVLMPNGYQSDIDDAYRLVDELGITYIVVDISSAVSSIAYEVGERQLSRPHAGSYHSINYNLSEQASINLPARIRMATLYAVSQSNNGRVMNTCNLSEDYIGYSTRYGDAAGDFAPLADLTTDEVIKVGKACGLPDEIVYKTPTDGLCGRTDEDNLGFSYEVLNRYIRTGICDDLYVKEKIDYLHQKNAFKLKPMPKFKYEGNSTE